MLQSRGLQRVGYDLATEQQQQQKNQDDADQTTVRLMSGQVSRGSAGEYKADEQELSRSSAGEYQADEQAGVARLR